MVHPLTAFQRPAIVLGDGSGRGRPGLGQWRGMPPARYPAALQGISTMNLENPRARILVLLILAIAAAVSMWAVGIATSPR